MQETLPRLGSYGCFDWHGYFVTGYLTRDVCSWSVLVYVVVGIDDINEEEDLGTVSAHCHQKGTRDMF